MTQLKLNIHAGENSKTEWLTDPAIIKSLGEFDLDPCSPIARPWPTAKHHYTIEDDGLTLGWFGRVWLNPPYGKELAQWIERLSRHDNGLALIPARLDTRVFHDLIAPLADSYFVFRGRLNFFHVDGTPGRFNMGCASMLIAYGENNSESIDSSGLIGKHLPLNRIGIVVIGIDSTWRSIVKTVFVRLNKESSLDEIYNVAEEVAPEKVSRNQHYKEKIRQTLQLHFNRVKRGVYSMN